MEVKNSCVLKSSDPKSVYEGRVARTRLTLYRVRQHPEGRDRLWTPGGTWWVASACFHSAERLCATAFCCEVFSCEFVAYAFVLWGSSVV